MKINLEFNDFIQCQIIVLKLNFTLKVKVYKSIFISLEEKETLSVENTILKKISYRRELNSQLVKEEHMGEILEQLPAPMIMLGDFDPHNPI